MSGECWLPVPGYEGIYEVSDLGRIRSLDRVVVQRLRRNGKVYERRQRYLGKILRPTPNTAGYPQVRLQGGRIARVHTLVLEAFVGAPAPGQECRHADADRSNPRLSNLCWGTRAENMADMMAHGNYRGGARPGDTPGAKLTPSQVIEMRARLDAGEHPSAVAHDYGVSRTTASGIRDRKIWTHV